MFDAYGVKQVREVMGTAMIGIVLLVIVIFAAKNSLKHVKGEGGCCGGGGGSVSEEPVKLKAPVAARKILRIEGMHCEQCKNHVMRQIQRIEGVSCKVDLKKNIASVEMDRDISDDELIIAVERAGYEVLSIEDC